VNYAVQGQDASGLSFGERRQTQPPRLDEDVVKLAAKGIRVFVVDDDLRERGIGPDDLVPGLQPVARAEVAALFARYDQVWHW
jgi:sulfur relay (sulfurtransferase) DsrF/TusC family protein